MRHERDGMVGHTIVISSNTVGSSFMKDLSPMVAILVKKVITNLSLTSEGADPDKFAVSQ